MMLTTIKVNHKQKGVALVVVLLVVALVAVIASSITEHSQREIRRSANILDFQQARSYALGAEHFAISVLNKQVKDSPDRDDLSQTWATEGLYFPVEGGDLTGVITDLNACFNLNSLVQDKQELGLVADEDSLAFKSFQQLLTLLDLNPKLAVAVADWLDSDERTDSIDGAEDLEYQLLDPPYRAANNLIYDISELLLIQGFNQENMNRLKPYVCAIPQAGYFKININTISTDKPEILSMLIPDLSLDKASLLLAQRAQSGYDELQSFWQQQELAGIEVDPKSKSVIQLDSDYYQLQSKARIGRGHASLITLFEQIDTERVRILWRKFGA